VGGLVELLVNPRFFHVKWELGSIKEECSPARIAGLRVSSYMTTAAAGMHWQSLDKRRRIRAVEGMGKEDEVV
jgi:hypothetical protein